MITRQTHFMKPIFTTLFVLCFLLVKSQDKKPFFNNIYVSGMGGFEYYQVDQGRWKDLYKDRASIPYLLDTMYTSVAKDGVLIPKIYGAFAISAGKLLIPENRWAKQRNLEWRTAFFYKAINYYPSRYGFSTLDFYPSDTLQPVNEKLVYLQQNKRLIDWQNTLVYKSRNVGKSKIRLNIGMGFGISTTLSNRILETYENVTRTWNTARRTYDVQKTTLNDGSFKAKPETHLSLLVYLGTEFRISDKYSLLLDGHYSTAHYPYSKYNKKTEGYWTGVSFCYKLK
jgi:hypothetical protein